MWDATLPPGELFDVIERAEVGEGLAESAFAMTGDWDGKAYDPPAAEQPGVYAWGEAHLLLAYVLQYEATAETRYLDTFLRRFRLLLSLRDDRRGTRDILRGRVMPAWGSVRFSQGQHTCFIVHAGMLLFPAASFLDLAAKSPVLRARYAGEIEELARAVTETVAAFDDEWHEGPGDGEGYYTDVAYGGQYLPLNQQNCLGRVMLRMLSTTGSAAYRERAERLAVYLKNRLILRPDGAYQWQYRPPQHPPFDGPAEDISHAAMNVDYAALCHQYGIIFTREDLTRMAATFLQVIRRAPGRFADYVDGSGDENLYANVIAYWGNLAVVEPEIIRVIRATAFQHAAPLSGPLALLTLAVAG